MGGTNMPEPRDNEDKGSFIGRCMEDSESKRDFPNKDQRLAFCQSQWDRKSGEKRAARLIELARTQEPMSAEELKQYLQRHGYESTDE